MSYLIILRQRIKAIETIRKVTHAMQLISMSSHSRLRQKKNALEQYKNTIAQLWCKIINCTPNWQQYITTPAPGETKENLVILIGAQKGLSGAFSTQLLNFFGKDQPLAQPYTTLIAVGKHTAYQLEQHNIHPALSHTNFTPAHITTIAQHITRYITEPIRYSSVVVYTSYPKTFFLQKQKKVSLTPYLPEATTTKCSRECPEYIWEQDTAEIVRSLFRLNINATILELLFDSLLAEQAARFISMESATRNAQNLLNDMRLEYNKRRQAKITLELTDLTASTLAQE